MMYSYGQALERIKRVINSLKEGDDYKEQRNIAYRYIERLISKMPLKNQYELYSYYSELKFSCDKNVQREAWLGQSAFAQYSAQQAIAQQLSPNLLNCLGGLGGIIQ